MARVELSLELNQIVNRVDQREWSLPRDGLNAGNIELPTRGSALIMCANVIPRSVEERRYAAEGPVGLETYQVLTLQPTEKTDTGGPCGTEGLNHTRRGL